MRMAISEAIIALVEAERSICCPSCGSKGPYVHEVKRFNPLIESEDAVHSYDSFRCLNCHQRWTVAFRLVYSPTVEYIDHVGDKIDVDKPLTELL